MSRQTSILLIAATASAYLLVVVCCQHQQLQQQQQLRHAMEQLDYDKPFNVCRGNCQIPVRAKDQGENGDGGTSDCAFDATAPTMYPLPQQLHNHGKNTRDKNGNDDDDSGWTQMSDGFQKFLKTKVFGQESVRAESGSFLSHVQEDPMEEEDGGLYSGGGGDARASRTAADASSDSVPSLTATLSVWMDGMAESFKKMKSDWDKSNENNHSSNNDNNSKEEEHQKQSPVLAELLAATHQWRNEKTELPSLDTLKVLIDAIKDVLDQLKRTFGDILKNTDSLPLAMIYYVNREDSVKTVSWKRRQHLWYPQTSTPVIVELHDALYLSQLAYVDSLTTFTDGLSKFRNNTWQLVYGVTESRPDYPANFLIVHKQLAPLSAAGPQRGKYGARVSEKQAFQSILPWEASPWLDELDEKKPRSDIEVTLVVRGTKELTDVLSDGLLEPVPYRGGLAHGGILKGGMNLVKEHLPKLRQILEYSGRDQIKLFIVGHSLGAGAGAIAAMEFNEYDFISVEAIGFGCPALLSQELSEGTKDYITTVVADADIVPRMSGATLVNVLMDMMEYDWRDPFLKDLEFYVARAKVVSPLARLLPSSDDLKRWVQQLVAGGDDNSSNGDDDGMPDGDNDSTNGSSKYERVQPLLSPPGSCIHIYRDGIGYSGTSTPCNFFQEIDVSRSLVDDHLVMTGYHRAMITILRDRAQDYSFDFEHDIAAIPC